MTQRIATNPWAVGRVTPCAPLLTSQRTGFRQPPSSQCFTLKKPIMQVPVFTLCYTAANVSNPAGRIATGFPLPSTGRGIEGEGWSYPEPPRASLRWWTKSRCDFVCLRSRHFVAWLRRGLAHDAIAIHVSKPSPSPPPRCFPEHLITEH